MGLHLHWTIFISSVEEGYHFLANSKMVTEAWPHWSTIDVWLWALAAFGTVPSYSLLCSDKGGEDSQTGNVAGTFHFLFSLLSLSLSYSEPLIGFFFPDFPWVDCNCNFQIAHLFVVSIDLVTKRFVKAKLDDQVLNAKEATILLWYNTGE